MARLQGALRSLALCVAHGFLGHRTNAVPILDAGDTLVVDIEHVQHSGVKCQTHRNATTLHSLACLVDGSVVLNGHRLGATVPCAFDASETEWPKAVDEGSPSCAAARLLQDVHSGRVTKQQLELVIARHTEDFTWSDAWSCSQRDSSWIPAFRLHARKRARCCAQSEVRRLSVHSLWRLPLSAGHARSTLGAMLPRY